MTKHYWMVEPVLPPQPHFRVEASYVYAIRRTKHVDRTVHVRPDLLVDLLRDGRVAGVEKIGGAITVEDLASVLFAVPFEGVSPSVGRRGIRPYWNGTRLVIPEPEQMDPNYDPPGDDDEVGTD